MRPVSWWERFLLWVSSTLEDTKKQAAGKTHETARCKFIQPQMHSLNLPFDGWGDRPRGGSNPRKGTQDENPNPRGSQGPRTG